MGKWMPSFSWRTWRTYWSSQNQMTLIVLREYTFTHLFVASKLSFCQYKNHKSSQVFTHWTFEMENTSRGSLWLTSIINQIHIFSSIAGLDLIVPHFSETTSLQTKTNQKMLWGSANGTLLLAPQSRWSRASQRALARHRGPQGGRGTPTICSSPPPLFSCNLRVASSRSKLESRRSHLSWWSTSVWRFSAIQVTLKASSKLPQSLSSTEGALQMRGESKLSNVKPVTLPSRELFEVIFEGPHRSQSQTNKTKKKK